MLPSLMAFWQTNHTEYEEGLSLWYSNLQQFQLQLQGSEQWHFILSTTDYLGLKLLWLKREYGTMSEMFRVICNFTAHSKILFVRWVHSNHELRLFAVRRDKIKYHRGNFTNRTMFIIYKERSMIKDEDVLSELEESERRQPAVTKSSRGKPMNSESCTSQ